VITLAGYEGTEVIRADHRRCIYRARRVSDGCAVVIKTASAEVATARDVAVFRHEWEVLLGLELCGVERAVALERRGASLALVLADAGPRNLAERLAGGPLALGEFLELAAQLSEALGRLHAAHRIHRDVSPSNIVLDHEGSHATLVDFGTASTLDELEVEAKSPWQLEGSLPYLSPEQTGRTALSVDHRSDLYALGATFYEMLTGSPPFVSDDELELVHAHLALRPIPAHERSRHVPRVLSEIVSKLLAKAPDARYRSADALASDLREAQRRWARTGEVASFALARDDVPRHLHVSETLHGRDAELRVLMDAFDRARRGEREVVLVTGEPGTGKSALVRRLHVPLTRARGLFAAGECDALRRSEPYFALVAALRDLLQQILAEPEQSLAEWRASIATAVAPHGKVLTDVLPVLELILGPQPDVPALGPAASADRFFAVFQRLLRVFARDGSPLVLFLDDLQWIDSASLRLVEQLLGDPTQRNLLFIGTFRESEVGPGHPLRRSLSAAREAHVAVHTVRLEALPMDDVVRLCADSLATDPERARALAASIMRKTGGNPLFVRCLLSLLQVEGTVRFDAAQRAWVWDLAALEGGAAPNDLADLMARAIERLPAACRELVEQGSCIGHFVELGLLAELHGKTLPATVDALWPALQGQLLVPVGDAYKLPRHEGPLDGSLSSLDARVRFVHEGVREAALSRLDDAARQGIHLTVGRLLLERMSAEGNDERLFEVVDHLDSAAAIVDDRGERQRLAALDLRAGRKAKVSGAGHAALDYLETAAALLPANPWTDDASLAFAISRERAECTYVEGETARADALVDEALAHTASPAEGADLLALRIASRTEAADYAAAFAAGRAALAMVGDELPALDRIGAGAKREAEALRRELEGRPIDELVSLPDVTDPDARSIMQVLGALFPAARFFDARLESYVSARLLRLSLRHGNSAESPLAYVIYARDGPRDRTTALALSKLGVELARRRGDLAAQCATLTVFAIGVGPCAHGLRESARLMRDAIRLGLEVGERHHAALAGCLLPILCFLAGEPLEDVLAENERGIAMAATPSGRVARDLALPTRQAVRCLLGRTASPATFDDADFEEAVFARGANRFAAGQLCLLRLACANVFGELEIARRVAPLAALGYPRHHFFLAERAFQSALAYAASCDGASDSERAAWVDDVRMHEMQLAAWSEGLPECFRHKHDLVRAEVARLTSDPWTAEGLYELAVEGARAHGAAQDHALTEERAARFHLAHARRRIAKIHLEAALHVYAHWGATAKVDALENAHRDLLTGFESLPAGARAGVTPVSKPIVALDARSLIKATQAVSGEMVLEQLLEKLLRIVVESAGAERGSLLLEEKAALMVRARAWIEEAVSLERGPLGADWPRSIVEHVWRSGEPVVLADATREGSFTDDPCVRERGIRSVLCLPVRRHARSIGVLYLDNGVTPYAFPPERIEVVQHLAAQLAISLENAQLLRRAENEVRKRDEFLAVAAHELRTPLTPLFLQIASASRAARSLGPEAGATIMPHLGAAQGQLENLQNLVEDLLELARVATGQMSVIREPTDLAGVVRDVVASLEPKLARAGCAVTLDARGPIIGMWDGQRVGQAASNLLSNAIKFGTGSPIEVTVESVDGMARLSVRDHGIGIPPEDHERIFGPFERAVSLRHYGGFGVGLWTARRIVEAHGGTIRVESRPGEGAKFIVDLPRRGRSRTV
jgi:predicted ATPase/signal transduction histidine kinase